MPKKIEGSRKNKPSDKTTLFEPVDDGESLEEEALLEFED